MSVLQPQPPGIPVPRPSAASAPYWEGCAKGELRIQRCGECGLAIAEAARVCWRCHSTDLRWEASSGRGRLYSWSVVWRPQTPAFHVPYAVAIVELEEGIHVLSAVVGCRPEDLADGMELAVEFHSAGDQIVLPYFRPVHPTE